MTNTQTFAQKELDILLSLHTDPENKCILEPFVPEILALCEKFGNNGESGGSAPYTAAAISGVLKNLLLQRPIAPLTGIEEEWMLVDDSNDLIYQNNRCSAVFKTDKDGPYYLDAIVFVGVEGDQFTGSAHVLNGNKIRSRQFIRSFPFSPKTFYLDVTTDADGNHHVKDETQLPAIEEYYDVKYH